MIYKKLSLKIGLNAIKTSASLKKLNNIGYSSPRNNFEKKKKKKVFCKI